MAVCRHRHFDLQGVKCELDRGHEGSHRAVAVADGGEVTHIWDDHPLTEASMAELREVAESAGVEVRPGMTREDIFEAMRPGPGEEE